MDPLAIVRVRKVVASDPVAPYVLILVGLADPGEQCDDDEQGSQGKRMEPEREFQFLWLVGFRIRRRHGSSRVW